ncbi:MAG: glutathione peroxidase [Lachnospiraceae bacterium]|nr:glutathione peroxidase [Lachnospiraceae bacterium]
MSIYDYTVKARKGATLNMEEMKGKVLLIVNTATGCGFTPQYEAIEKLYEKYHDQGFEVLDFPCNQFGHQAPGDESEIHEFCTAKYKTQFDQLAKIDVNGENEEPLFTYLKSQMPDEEIEGEKNKSIMDKIATISATCKKPSDIKWNFTKFLVDREGNVVKRFNPTSNPADFEADIEALL